VLMACFDARVRFPNFDKHQEASNMRFKFFALIVTIAVTLVLTGCENNNTNTTANTNANANHNANTAIATSTPVPTNTANDNRRAPTREEYERDKERYSREAKESGRTVGTGLNDGWLWVKARFDLAAADDLRDSTINVDVSNAVVTLTGTVANQAQVAKADQIAKSIEGIKGVQNKLKVAANTNANSNKANANSKAKSK
jgi:hyperosmotically inducible periplasmic protein